MNVKLYKACVKLLLPHNEKHVLRSLASFAGRDCCEAYPSVGTLARDTGLGETMVRRQLRWLQKKGAIAPIGNTKGGKGRSTRYLISPGGLIEPDTSVTPFRDGKPVAAGEKGSAPEGKTRHACGDDGVEKEKERENDFPKLQGTVWGDLDRNVWSLYIECVEPGSNYFPTINRKTMLVSRYQEMIANGKTWEEALTHMREAIIAFSEDPYHMGKKKGYGSRKGIEEIFRTEEIFQDWCSKYRECKQ